MTTFGKGKLALCLGVIFVAGGVTGAALTWGKAERKWTRAPDPNKMCDFFRTTLERELGLSAEQVTKLDPLLKRRVQAMEEVRERSVVEIDEVFRKSHEEMVTELGLSAEQQAKLQEMEQKRKAFSHRSRDGKFKDWKDGGRKRRETTEP